MNALEKYRIDNGLTYQALAEKAGTDVGNTYRNCRGTKPLGADYALRYHAALGIPLEQLRPDLYENRGASQEPPPEVTA